MTRTLLHLGLVLVSGYLVNLVLKRRKSERVYSDKKIEKLEETNRRVEDFLAMFLMNCVHRLMRLQVFLPSCCKKKKSKKKESSYPRYKWPENDYLVKLKIF